MPLPAQLIRTKRHQQAILVAAIAAACHELIESSKSIQIPNACFDFDALDDATYAFLFRFNKQSIMDLVVELELPEVVITEGRHALEALLIVLRRMSYLGRLGDLAQT
ncbi:UNVERIFIED_CONTAM: hypothetical protein HDU68_003919, partial [Siphonaria sp. JEL0065]